MQETTHLYSDFFLFVSGTFGSTNILSFSSDIRGFRSQYSPLPEQVNLLPRSKAGISIIAWSVKSCANGGMVVGDIDACKHVKYTRRCSSRHVRRPLGRMLYYVSTGALCTEHDKTGANKATGSKNARDTRSEVFQW
jgi:hypothetical protein